MHSSDHDEACFANVALAPNSNRYGMLAMSCNPWIAVGPCVKIACTQAVNGLRCLLLVPVLHADT